VPPAVDDEAGGADDVHPLVDRRLAGQAAHRQQEIGREDEQSARPAGNLDQESERAQAASFLST
jgi:hypothetical protein